MNSNGGLVPDTDFSKTYWSSNLVASNASLDSTVRIIWILEKW